jgi:hypothetical protein
LENQDESTKSFHFVLFHLKTVLDFSTPYVKSVCLPYFQLSRLVHGNNQTKFLHGGFIKIKVPKALNSTKTTKIRESNQVYGGLHLQSVETGFGYDCVKTYEKYYDGIFPSGIFCAKILSQSMYHFMEHLCK